MQNVLVRPQAAVIQPLGSLHSGNITTFQYQLNAAVLSEKHSSLLVDMAQVESIDSDGLMALVAALSLSQRLNKRFSLCSISHSVRIILELTQLDRVFEILEGRYVLGEVAA
ncbi:STAS domain-containing protein [Stenomitos frigidus]|uniref:Anti-anti-sigma factor n=1 Tax=Stenomitos frigidus ULC18 TaxID=2107698 RepID=A0A2T1E269_9CYAN|nr:STAS domain-containing protein [Stenomitos frigidus]PSB26839.1 anti-anti-sigma factor [Stenomitos frigidus ULC18]